MSKTEARETGGGVAGARANPTYNEKGNACNFGPML